MTWDFQQRLLHPSTIGADVKPSSNIDAQVISDHNHQEIDFLSQIFTSDVQFAAHFYENVRQLVKKQVQQAAEQLVPSEASHVFKAGVACLQSYLKHNYVGPWEPAPPSPLQLLAPHLADCPVSETHDEVNSTSSNIVTGLPESAIPPPAQELGDRAYDGNTAAGATLGLGVDSQHPHERWAGQQLALDGEDLVGKCSALQYLLLAQIMLVEPLLGSAADNVKDQSSKVPAWQENVRESLLTAFPAWSWFALRATSLHQQILDGRSAQLWARSQLLTQHLLSSWALPAAAQQLPGHAFESQTLIGEAKSAHTACTACLEGLAAESGLLACLFLELAQVQHAAGYVDAGERLLHDAGAVLGLEVGVTGALGKRTVHQVDAKAQLVVRARRERAAGVAGKDSSGSTVEPLVQDMGLGVISQKAATGNADAGGDVDMKETAGLSVDEDVLLVPKLIDEEGKELESVYVSAEQALLLSWAQHIKTSTSQDELQAWDMAPYVEAVLVQQRSQPALQAFSHLLKIRHEKGRGRTRERALLHMEQLVEALQRLQLQDDDATANTDSASARPQDADAISVSRLPYLFCTGFPLSMRLRKELAEQYLTLGFVSAAVRMFEQLEAWGALVLCYQLLEKKNLADTIIRKRLQVTPNDAGLWCSLGDLHLDETYYQIGWERSGCRHARSKRSLGRAALRRKDWTAAAEHYEAALSLNPLNPDAWFALGYAYLKIPGKQYQALKAFTRVTQQSPDHGEAWNNMAALWLDLNKYKEAFNALSQCVKHKRDSWQVWENYAAVAVKAGELNAAVQGLQQVLNVSGGQRLPVDTLKALMDAIEGKAAHQQDNTGGSAADEDTNAPEASDQDLGSWLLDLPGLPGGAAGTHLSGDGNAGATPSGSDEPSQYQKDIEAAAVKQKEKLIAILGMLLKDAVNSPCCGAGLWGCLASYHRITGHVESAKEALLKQVRSLTGTSYKSDEAKFVEMADASIALGQAYVQLYRQQQQTGSSAAPTPANTRELGAARMHLRGVLKQCEGSFQEHPLWQKMDGLLHEVVELENVALAAARAAEESA